jgi:hypothetical protein
MAQLIRRIQRERKVLSTQEVSFGVFPEDLPCLGVRVVPEDTANYEIVLKLTPGEALILSRNLTAVLDELHEKRQGRLKTFWERLMGF